MATKKAPPRRNTDVIRCENCGEEYSTTYKRCPFCDERPGSQGRAPVGGRRVSGGGRSRRPNPMQLAGLVISLALIITAVVIVFTSLAPMIFHKTPSGDASGSGQSSSSQGVQGAEVTLNGLTLSPDRSGPSGGGALSAHCDHRPSGRPGHGGVDQQRHRCGHCGPVWQCDQCVPGERYRLRHHHRRSGGQTAQCMVQCTGDGSGANIAPSGSGQEETGQGGQSAGTSGTLAPNTEAVITGASGGLNIRSGPGTNYEAKASTADGAVVTVLEDAGNGWCKIKYATGGGVYDEGYVMFQYLAANK